MAEQREDDELKELTFTVKVKVQVRADLPEEGLRVEGAELHLVRGEGASKAYPQTRVRWMEFSSILGESDDYTRGLEDERARCTTLAAECHARLLDMWSPARHALDALHAAIRNGRAAPKQPSQPATAAWEAADLEGRMVTLNMLLEEATRLEQLYAERGRTSTSAAAMRLAHAVLQRPDTIDARDMSKEEYEAAVTAVEVQRDVRKFLEELASDYTHDAVDHRVSRDICRRCRAIRLLKALEELQQK